MPEEDRDAVQVALQSCHEDHQGDHEAMKSCTEGVASQYGLILPESHGFGRGGRHGGFMSGFQNLDETEQSAMFAEIRTCAQSSASLSDFATCVRDARAASRNI